MVCVFGCLSLSPLSSAAIDLPEPGPENGGMRLRFIVVPERKGTSETYQVRLDVINVTDQPIRLMGDWPSDSNSGDYKEYLRSDVSFQMEPPIRKWPLQVGVAERKSPQPEYTLNAKETLTVEWKSSGRQLKNKEIHYHENHNPIFPTDGLYFVHATLLLRLVGDGQGQNVETVRPTDLSKPLTNKNGAKRAKEAVRREAARSFAKAASDSRPHGTIRLRSNEQMVPIGGSYASPKHSLARLWSVNTNDSTAKIDLGISHKIETGDQFLIQTGALEFWNLQIRRIENDYSEGQLIPVTWMWQHPTKPKPGFPREGAPAALNTGIIPYRTN